MTLFEPEEIAPSDQEKTRDQTTSDEPVFDETAPLAARLRPRHLDEFVGQKHLVGEGAPLRRAAERDRVPSCIFFGPAGVGKTTLARLLARGASAHFEDFSAITGGVADVRKIVASAKIRKSNGRKTLLFVDEIHRFNRAQQDAFLPHVEDGTLTLLGATTENPLAALNTPLLSRCRLFAFEPLGESDILELLERAMRDPRGFGTGNWRAQLEALQFIARVAGGDARLALGALEIAADLAVDAQITLEGAREALGKRTIAYDLHGDAHYDTISAYIKSLRGGSPDSALYWLMLMLEGGEDPMFVARRLVIAASEDVGNGDPMALLLANAALAAVEKIGMPEAAIPLAHATTYVASAPKSNAAYLAMHRAKAAVAEGEVVRVPPHLRSTGLGKRQKEMGNGQGYLYPHDFEGAFVEQDYGAAFGEFYRPTEIGHEAKIKRRLESWWEKE